MLSDRFIRNAKPGKYADEEGLYLRVYDTGKRTFFLRAQHNGRDVTRTLGQYPDMGLAAARTEAKKLRSGNLAMTLREAFTAYYAHLAAQFKDPAQSQRMIEKDVLNAPIDHAIPSVLYGERRLDMMKRADYTTLLARVVERGAPVMANRLLTQTKRFLRHCEEMGWVEANPLSITRYATIGGPEAPRSRALAWSEIVAFLRLLRTTPMFPGCRAAMYFSLATGCRSGESIYCLRNKTLVIPPGATKSQREHVIPPTPHTRAIIRMAPKPPVLPSTIAQVLRKHHQDFTPHDLRRTFASRMADMGVAPHVIEKLLNHRMQGVMSVYNRAEYWPERLAAQALWDKKLRELRHLAAQACA